MPFALPCPQAQADAVLPVRDHNPFLQIFGAPAFASALVVPAGPARYALNLDIANHADDSRAGAESVVLDGETYTLTWSAYRRLHPRLALRIDVPVVAHVNGVFDPAIEAWHDLIGLSNSKRDGPSNRLRLAYNRGNEGAFLLDSDAVGPGDLRVTASVPLWTAGPGSPGSSLTWRSTIKLPTGDADDLAGSGAADLALSLHGTRVGSLRDRRLELTAMAGVLVLGDGDVLPSLQRDTVGFGGAAAALRMTPRLDVALQVYARDAYFDSDLDEIGGRSIQLALGGLYCLPGGASSLSFGLIEDVFSDATTDVAFQFGMRWAPCR
jgi:hypothetical protein